MAKGAIAKESVIKKITEAFGADYLGEVDKKYYVQAEENGEMVQVALSLTCPKTPVAFSGYVSVSGPAEMPVEAPRASIEISDDEKKNIADLIARLGL